MFERSNVLDWFATDVGEMPDRRGPPDDVGAVPNGENAVNPEEPAPENDVNPEEPAPENDEPGDESEDDDFQPEARQPPLPRVIVPPPARPAADVHDSEEGDSGVDDGGTESQRRDKKSALSAEHVDEASGAAPKRTLPLRP
ncbi:hypothetical protein R1sor_027296 [Riccia sorocarpa]|uniref:Uncharacterized protein n=1 Tax=Riccia sorocarpa TaxID=122646 RepID=A0ABD3GEI9_9MARC